MKPQLTLNNSSILKVVVNPKTGKFFRARLNKDTDRRTDFSWTDQVRLAESWVSASEKEIIADLTKHWPLEEKDIEIKYFQLQYVEIN
jgi:hypothetical protein